MPNLAVVDMEGKNVGTIELAESVFGIEPNAAVMHQMVVNYLAAQRQGTQSALTRSEVSGGGKKPWRQKGTGRARQGSIRSPQWTHGGIALGPKPRDYSYSINKKVKRLAICSALSAKAAEGKLVIVNDYAIADYSTKAVVKMLKNIGVSGKTLMVQAVADEKVVKSARNLPNVQTALTNTINVYDVMKGGTVILTKDAVKTIEEVYA